MHVTHGKPAIRGSMVLTVTALASCAVQPGTTPKIPLAATRPAPLQPPLGWEIYPLSHDALFTGLRRGQSIYLSCSRTRPIRLFYFVPGSARRPGGVSLISGPVSTSYRVEVQENRAAPPPSSTDPGPLVGFIVAANVPRSDPALSRFFDTGELSLAWGGERMRADIRAGELAALRQICDQ